MKRFILAIALTVLVATPALAGGDVDFFASYTSFEQAEEAAGVGIRLGWNFSPNFSTDVAITLQEEGELTPSTEWYGNIRATPIDFGVRYRFDVGFYVGAGVSYFFFDTDNSQIDNEIGYYGRVGFDHVGPSGWGWFIEGNYRDVNAKVHVTDTFVEGGVEMSGAGGMVGAKFRWN